MKRGGLVSKGTLNRLRVQVQQAWERRDLAQCTELLERIVRLHPGDVWALQQLGRLHGERHQYDRAVEFFDRACQMAPPNEKALAFASVGNLARDFYDPGISEAYFNRAIHERGATAEMFVKAAEVAERNRRMADADRLVAHALQLNPKSASAWYLRAHLQQRAGNLEEAEKQLRPLLEITIAPEVRVRAWYEMGSVLDRQKRYDEAMSAFLQAKALLRYQGGPHLKERAVVRRRYAMLREGLTEDILRRWHEQGSAFTPPARLALLGGHPRSGTTLLEQVLDSHPEIVSMEESDTFGTYVGMPLTSRKGPEVPFLEMLESVTAGELAPLREAYLKASEACIGAPLDGRLLIDKHPSLTISIPTIARAFPEIRFLIALRDPRDVVLSCFMQPFQPIAQGNAAFLGLDTAVEEYAELMGMWLKLKEILPNPHLEVHYEDMVEDLESVARTVLGFLDVPWDPAVLGFDEHAQKKRVRSPTYADVTQKVFKRARGRWRNYEKYLSPHLGRLEPFLKAFGYES